MDHNSRVSPSQWKATEALLEDLGLEEDALNPVEDDVKVISFRATVGEWNWLQKRASIKCGISRARYMRLLFLAHRAAVGG